MNRTMGQAEKGLSPSRLRILSKPVERGDLELDRGALELEQRKPGMRWKEELELRESVVGLTL